MLRTLIPLALLIIATLAYAFGFDFGTVSTLGLGFVSLICPLGALFTLLASVLPSVSLGAFTLDTAVLVRIIASLVIVVLLVVVFGKAFCAWVCPVPLVQKIRGLFVRPSKANLTHENQVSVHGTMVNSAKSPSHCSSCAKTQAALLDSRHLILGGGMLSALIFGFPIFCLICPIGLTFASIFLLVNLFTGADLTWAILLAPAFLIIEVVVFKKWCAKICPMGALFSLLSKFNKTFRPKINDEVCLETASRSAGSEVVGGPQSGKTCGICGRVCPEGIDPRHYNNPCYTGKKWNECTKCRVCVDNCPSKALTLPMK
jgi:ferredoxin-type protein NapH